MHYLQLIKQHSILRNEVKCPVIYRCRHQTTGHTVWITDQAPWAPEPVTWIQAIASTDQYTIQLPFFSPDIQDTIQLMNHSAINYFWPFGYRICLITKCLLCQISLLFRSQCIHICHFRATGKKLTFVWFLIGILAPTV